MERRKGEPPMPRTIVLMLALLLAACANAGKTNDSGDVLSLAPISSEIVDVDYQRLSECVYARLEQPGLRKADLPTSRTVKVGVDGSGVRYWELSFVSAGQNRTRVDLAAVRTIWGPDTNSTRDLMPAVHSCAGV
jgi:hypothetical protein